MNSLQVQKDNGGHEGGEYKIRHHKKGRKDKSRPGSDRARESVRRPPKKEEQKKEK